MMTVIVTARSVFGITVSGAKTGIMCLQNRGGGKVLFTINAIQTNNRVVVYLGGAISANRQHSIENTRRLQRAWACLQRHKM